MPAHQNGKSKQGSESTPEDVALLIDYENLQVSLRKHFNLTTPKMSLIIQEALEYGRLVLSRAYAPWTNSELSIDAENLYRQGIDLIYTPAGKNSADVRMAVDAVDLTQRMQNLGTIIFVTGDGDLIHPLNYLRQAGSRVVVIGVDAAMSRMLSSAADAVLIYERDLDPSVRRRAVRTVSNGTRPQAPAAPSVPKERQMPTTAFEPLQKVLQNRGDGEPMLYQEIGHWLGTDYGLKPRAAFGVPFSVFMENAQQAGVVNLTTSGGNSYASLPTTANDSDDDIDDDDDEPMLGSAVRLESLQQEERQALYHVLKELNDNPKLHYFTFRRVLNKLLQTSALPRLNEGQIRSLLNDLANREPQLLIREIRQSRTPQGQNYSFSAFTLNPDASLFQLEESEDTIDEFEVPEN